MGTVLEHYAWVAIIAGWSLLLLLGLAGGDPFTARQPRWEARLVQLVKQAAQVWFGRQPALRTVPARQPSTHLATESGLHAAV